MAMSPTIVWLIIGTGCCSIELFVPTAFILFVMGLSAFGVAAVAGAIPLVLQVLLWVALSLAMVLYSRRFVNRKAARKLDATEAKTLTEIQPGQGGRVLYEGNSWAARCSESQGPIAPGQRVYVVGRQGTTLIVMPEHFQIPEDF